MGSASACPLRSVWRQIRFGRWQEKGEHPEVKSGLNACWQDCHSTAGSTAALLVHTDVIRHMARAWHTMTYNEQHAEEQSPTSPWASTDNPPSDCSISPSNQPSTCYLKQLLKSSHIQNHGFRIVTQLSISVFGWFSPKWHHFLCTYQVVDGSTNHLRLPFVVDVPETHKSNMGHKW